MNRIFSNFIKNRQEPFRLTYWDGKISLTEIEINEIYRLCVASLVRDFKFNEKIKLRNGELVELSMNIDGDIKLGRFIYRGIIDTDAEVFPQIQLEEPGNIKYFISAEHLWRLKRIEALGRLNRNRQLAYGDLKILNVRMNPQIALTLDPLRKLVEDTGIEKRDLFTFKRTKIILLLKNSLIKYDEDVRYPRELIQLSQIFPIGSCTSKIIRDWNWEPHLMTQRGFDNDLICFAFFENVIDFIKEHPQEKFLIITDKYNQVYDEELYQTYTDFFIDEKNKNRVSLIVIPKVKQLSNIFNDQSTPVDNGFITPIVIPSKIIARKELHEQIFLADDTDLDLQYQNLENKIYKYKHADLPYANIFKNIKWLSFTLLEKPSSVYDSFVQSKNKFINEEENIKVVQDLEDEILTKKIKLSKIEEIFESDNNTFIYVNSLTERDFNDEKYNNRTFGRSQFDSLKLSFKVLVIYFIDLWFIRDCLLPEILFGNIKMKNVKFVLYKHEYKVLKTILKYFSQKINPLIKNSDILSPGTEINFLEDADEPEPIDFTELPDYDTDLNPFVNRLYLKSGDSRENDPVVDIHTYFYKDTNNNRYVAHLTESFSPYILKNGSKLRKIRLKETNSEDLFLFFGGEGARDILHNYPILYYNNIDEERKYKTYLKLTDKWRIALQAYNDAHGSNNLKNKLIGYGLEMSDNKLERWLNDDTMIGPQNPRLEIEKIAKAVGDEGFKKNYWEVAEACLFFQSKAKSIGKKLRKIALAEFSEITQEKFYVDLSEEGKQKISEIAESIKCVRLIYHEDAAQKVYRSDSNKLFPLD